MLETIINDAENSVVSPSASKKYIRSRDPRNDFSIVITLYNNNNRRPYEDRHFWASGCCCTLGRKIEISKRMRDTKLDFYEKTNVLYDNSRIPRKFCHKLVPVEGLFFNISGTFLIVTGWL